MDYIAFSTLTLNGNTYERGDVIAPEDVPTTNLRRFLDKGLIDVVNEDADLSTLTDRVTALEQDTGWRKFPEQSFTLTIGAQSNIAYRVSLLQRRIGSLVFCGVLWARDTEYTITTGQAWKDLVVPTEWLPMPAGVYGTSATYAIAPDAATGGPVLFYVLSDITGASRPRLSIVSTTAANTSVVVGQDYQITVGPFITDEPFPDPLPGVAYPEIMPS